jgi:hypothetical protein
MGKIVVLSLNQFALGKRRLFAVVEPLIAIDRNVQNPLLMESSGKIGMQKREVRPVAFVDSINFAFVENRGKPCFGG